jgi:hypothetical protein
MISRIVRSDRATTIAPTPGGVKIVLPCRQYRLDRQDVATDQALRATHESMA